MHRIACLVALVGCVSAPPAEDDDEGKADGSGSGVLSSCPTPEFPAPVCGNAHWKWDSPKPSGRRLNAIWSFSSHDVWAAGGAGAVLHYDGQAWRVEQTPVCEDLHGIWGTSATNLWAVGEQGRIVRRTSNGWKIVESGTCEYLSAVWGAGSDVWIVGGAGTVLRRGSHGFAPVAFPGTGYIASIWGF